MVSARTPISRQVATGRVQPGLRGDINVGDTERLVSALGGGALAVFGLSRGSLGGLALAAVGGALVYRGVTGYCHCYEALSISTAEEHGRATSVAAGSGVKVEKSIMVQRPAEELYRFWRQLDNLPRIMRHLKSVTSQGGRSHWVARGPMGASVEWDAEIINERPGELIAWRSLEGSQVDTAGSVHFTPAPGGRGTDVRVTLKYDPPAGKAGSAVARLLGKEPAQQIEEDLRRFKYEMESAMPRQPVGRG
jgi:uncharacterized membrane protein